MAVLATTMLKLVGVGGQGVGEVVEVQPLDRAHDRRGDVRAAGRRGGARQREGGQQHGRRRRRRQDTRTGERGARRIRTVAVGGRRHGYVFDRRPRSPVDHSGDGCAPGRPRVTVMTSAPGPIPPPQGKAGDRIVWVDCEMTGLDLVSDALVEVACVVTDAELSELDAGVTVVIRPPDAAFAAMPDVVREMHTASRLIEEIPHGTTLEAARADRPSTTSAPTSPSRARRRWPGPACTSTAGSSPVTCPSSTRTCTTG